MEEITKAMGNILLYYLIAALTAFTLRSLIKINDELFRKGLHCILLGSLAVWLKGFTTWQYAAISCLVFAAAVYPLLALAGRLKGFTAFMNERKSGEFKSSLLLVFVMFALEIFLCWGWFGEKILVFAGVYAWGFGDAAAALVGRRFGKHTLEGRHIEGKKSLEGSLAMFVTSFICVGTVMLIRGNLPLYGYIVLPFAMGAVSAVVELYSMRGTDTITCPLAATAVMLALLSIMGGGA
ncbi:MAG: phosphatidate cytidylyltransferase [Eubacteriaceae bacterium]|nr:phosphatidate cytidylyltransferase [Eubacteriaceae bacterium]